MTQIVENLKKLNLQNSEVAFCRLGQHSFLVKIMDKLIAFDPYLSEDQRRLIPPMVTPEDLSEFDLIFGSHDHSDHIDRVVLSQLAAGRAKFIFPRAIINSINEISHERIIGMNDGEFFEFEGIKIYAIAAAHEFFDQTPDGLFPYLGFVIKYGDISIYHSGDCCVYEGLLTRLKKLSPAVMLLPINGRDAKRLAANCIGNMTYQEAADLAIWSGCKWVIPGHYDMFAMNLENVDLFLDYVKIKSPQLHSLKLNAGEIIKIQL